MKNVRKEALIKLLDDPSPIVHQSLLGEFQKLNEEAVSLLKSIIERGDQPLADAAKVYLQEITGDDGVEVFRAFIYSFQYELETGCILLDRTIHPEVEPEHISLFLDEMADRCEALITGPLDAVELCHILNRVMFNEYGFSGDREDFYSPENSFLHTVIERRKGIPITLSILYILLAQRCGLDLEPIALPGRFIVGCFEDSMPFYIDPYEGGVIMSEEEVQFLLYHYNVSETSEYLAPVTVGETLARMCRNLAHQYITANDEPRARLFLTFLQDFEEAYRRNS
jgi:regulator of sirC expression with transglutaminase-like and TPR domain